MNDRWAAVLELTAFTHAILDAVVSFIFRLVLRAFARMRRVFR